MKSKKTKPADSNRMFHAIVLMGSGLALNCGGVAKVDSSTSSGSSPAAANAGTGADTGTGGSNSTAFAGSAPGAGTGSNIVINVGGSSPAYSGTGGTTAAAGAPGAPPPCPPAQWYCSPDYLQCNPFDGGWTINSANCVCDTSRPTSAADCKPGYDFSCLSGDTGPAGDALTTNMAMECSCVPHAQSCEDACLEAFPDGGSSCNASSQRDAGVPSTFLCGCAIITLK